MDFLTKKWGFIQEKPQKQDFLISWGSIQEWGCNQADTVACYRTETALYRKISLNHVGTKRMYILKGSDSYVGMYDNFCVCNSFFKQTLNVHRYCRELDGKMSR